jgi:hypothetical protein
MSNTFNTAFLIDNAPSEEYRQQLLQLLQLSNPSKTLTLKNKFKTIMCLIKFIETECDRFNREWELCECKLYGSFVRQFCEAVYSLPTDTEYGDVTSHDIDLCVFSNISDYERKGCSERYLKLIDQFKMIILSEKKSFNFNGFYIIGLDDKTIHSRKKKETDSSGRKLLYDIPHYEIILENDLGEQIHVDLLAYAPNTHLDEFHLWNNDFNVNSLYITKRGIFTHDSKEDFFEVQQSIMDRYVVSRYPVKDLVKQIKSHSMVRAEKVKIYNQLIHYITYRMKILDDGYDKIYSDEEILDISIEREENCLITDASAPYIKVKMHCSHELSIMAFASIVNVRHTEFSESICCPYCRQILIPMLSEKKPPQIEIPVFPEHAFYNHDKIKPIDKKKNYISEENIATVSGLLQGLKVDEIVERRERIREGVERSSHNSYHV